MVPKEDPNQTNKSSEDSAAGPVCGERLARVRHERGISVLEIAKELHLDEPKVRALEENRFEVLGAPVFAKGHLRKYAELVGVQIDDILADYYGLNRSAGAPPVVGPPKKIPREISIGPWVGVILVVLLVASAAWWWFNLETGPEPVSAQPATLAPFESERQDDAAPVASDSEPVVDQESTEPPESSSTEEVQDMPVETPAEAEPESAEVLQASDTGGDPAAGNVELVLSFSDDCWTEVTDATGRRLFFDLGTDGRTVTLSGVEPLGVLLGNSLNVSIRVNGFDYRIPAANRRGNTARLTIYGQ
jgi:cytoskeleton protein RodZ